MHGGPAHERRHPGRATAAPARPERRGPSGERTVAVTSHTVLGIWSLLVLLPFAWTVVSSFKTNREIFASPFSLPREWRYQNYVDAWNTAGIGSYFFNSVVVVFSALVLTMVMGAMSAYVLARFDFRGRTVLRYLIVAGLTFPCSSRSSRCLHPPAGRCPQHAAGADPQLRDLRLPVHGVLPPELLRGAAG